MIENPKLGERVKLTAEGIARHHERPMTGTITQVDPKDANAVKVKIDGGGTRTYSLRDLERA